MPLNLLAALEFTKFECKIAVSKLRLSKKNMPPFAAQVLSLKSEYITLSEGVYEDEISVD